MERRGFMGGSDAAPALGISPYKTAFRLWLEKTGREPDHVENPRTIAGQVLEAAIVQLYRRLHGGDLPRREARALVHPAHPWMQGHIDRRMPGTRAIVECKLVGHQQARRWGDPERLELPQEYLLQVHHYLTVDPAKADHALILALMGTELRVYTVPRDPELSEMLVEREAEFWQHVVSDVPPVPDPRAGDTWQWLYPRARAGAVVEATQPAREQVELLRQLKRVAEDVETEITVAREAVCALMGEADTLVDVEGQKLATWSNVAGRDLVNLKKLKSKYPDVYADVVSQTAGARTFRVSNPKEQKR